MCVGMTEHEHLDMGLRVGRRVEVAQGSVLYGEHVRRKVLVSAGLMCQLSELDYANLVGKWSVAVYHFK